MSDQSRRAILSRMPAAAIGVGALLSTFVPAEAGASQATDQKFLTWERESNRLLALANIENKSDDEVDQIVDRQTVFERAILHTPSTSLEAARVRVRTLLVCFTGYMPEFVEPLEHVLSALSAV